MKSSIETSQARRTTLGSVAICSTLSATICLTLSGCWGTKKLDLMPTPLVHQQVGSKVYSDTLEESCSPAPEMYYATNRPETGGTASPDYPNGSGDRLHLGKVTLRVGDPSMSQDELRHSSTHEDRPEAIPLRIVNTKQIAVLGKSGDRNFAESVNRDLAKSADGSLTIFVPGAQSSFYKSCAHATHLKHFMASSSVCVTYSWPSTGRIVTYPQDIFYAREATRHLADLIEQLAATTTARRINVFTYSAGSQVVAPALASLQDRHPNLSAAELSARYRLGNVYFAAPEISAKQFFTEHLPIFSRFVERTTFTYNKDDRFLKASQLILLDPRAGRPTRGGSNRKEIAWLRTANQNPSIDAIDLAYSPAERPQDFSVHGAWYRNSWVGSDVLLLLQQNASASTRGLKDKPDGTGWYFPVDYAERLNRLGRQMWAHAPGETDRLAE
jgi:esterase/lipase superfamily enzyme